MRELNADHDSLDEFLNSQNYRLSYWKTADQQLGVPAILRRELR